jgi:hypothetical protein
MLNILAHTMQPCISAAFLFFFLVMSRHLPFGASAFDTLSGSPAHRFRHRRIRQHRFSDHLNRQAEMHRVYCRGNQSACIGTEDIPAKYFAIRIRQEFYAAVSLIVGDCAVVAVVLPAPPAPITIRSYGFLTIDSSSFVIFLFYPSQYFRILLCRATSSASLTLVMRGASQNTCGSDSSTRVRPPPGKSASFGMLIARKCTITSPSPFPGLTM